MEQRKPIVIMNWSMRQNLISEAEEYAVDVLNHQSENHKVEVVLLPSMGTSIKFQKFLQAVNLLSVLKIWPRSIKVNSVVNFRFNP